MLAVSAREQDKEEREGQTVAFPYRHFSDSGNLHSESQFSAAVRVRGNIRHLMFLQQLLFGENPRVIYIPPVFVFSNSDTLLDGNIKMSDSCLSCVFSWPLLLLLSSVLKMFFPFSSPRVPLSLYLLAYQVQFHVLSHCFPSSGFPKVVNTGYDFQFSHIYHLINVLMWIDVHP